MKKIKKQNKIKERIFCGVLAGILTFTACGVQKKDSLQQETAQKTEKNKEENAPMGRYREEKVKLPREVRKLFETKVKKDGTLQILFAGKPGSLYLYESGDGGKAGRAERIFRKAVCPTVSARQTPASDRMGQFLFLRELWRIILCLTGVRWEFLLIII